MYESRKSSPCDTTPSGENNAPAAKPHVTCLSNFALALPAHEQGEKQRDAARVKEAHEDAGCEAGGRQRDNTVGTYTA
jgi:hypothetical protein